MHEMTLSIHEVGFKICGMDRKRAFGRLIADARASEGLRGSDLAEKLGIATSTLSNLETGNFKYPPEPELLERIEAVLGIRKRALAIALGYIDVNETEPEMSPAVRRLGPLIDQIQWTDFLLKQTEGVLRLTRDAQRGTLTSPTPSWETEER